MITNYMDKENIKDSKKNISLKFGDRVRLLGEFYTGVEGRLMKQSYSRIEHQYIYTIRIDLTLSSNSSGFVYLDLPESEFEIILEE